METARIGASAQPSAREQTRTLIVGALEELGAPTRMKLLTEYIAVRFEATVDSRAISDMRRGEERRWDRHQGAGSPHVAPALEAVWFQPITKTLTLVEWPLARRIIGPWSERTDHLEVTRRLAELVAGQRNRALEALVTKLARTIPEALDGPFDPVRVAKAAEAELCSIGGRDRSWRAQAAQKAAGTLTPTEQRWGATITEDEDC
jgi:hypothetical protein